jgi:hypothetical protein
MEFKQNELYNYQYGKIKKETIQLKFKQEKKDYLYFTCERCGKDINHIYFFEDSGGSVYSFGSECVKKVISEIKD